MLKIFNTLTRQKEEFKPIHAGEVGMYVCGITVYDLCHIGHGRTFVAFDVVARYLRFLGYKLKYVRNITDIDDKIIKRANENGESFVALVDRMIAEMLSGLRCAEYSASGQRAACDAPYSGNYRAHPNLNRERARLCGG